MLAASGSDQKGVKMKIRYLLFYIVIGMVLSGCAAKIPSYYSDRPSAPQPAVSFYEHLDKQIQKFNINHSLGNKIKGFPYLRTNRFLTLLKDRLDSVQQKRQWVSHLQEYDLESRASEIKALPDASIRYLVNRFNQPEPTTRRDMIQLLTQYSTRLRAYDEQNPSYIPTLIKLTESPDDYSTPMRVIGFYPLAYGPVAYLTRKTYAKMNRQHRTDPADLAVSGTRVQYLPDTDIRPRMAQIERIFADTPKDSLGIQRFSPEDKKKLITCHAPVYLLDQADSNDIPGTIQTHGDTVVLDHEKPAVYTYFSHAVLDHRPMLQINYVIWFSARKGPDVPWYEKGAIDGFTYRVTLDDTGMPILIDIVHNCGCYHFFVPKRSVVKALKPAATQFGNQVPAWMPELSDNKRVMLTVSSGRHMIDHVGLKTVQPEMRSYKLLAYSELEALNIFDDNAIVKGSHRLEPLFLFPMGVPDIGAMRQRTHHPTRLLGREHFDNPLLPEQYFKFKVKDK